MFKRLLLLFVFLETITYTQSNLHLLLPKSIQLSFISQQNKIQDHDIAPEILYCIEVLQNIAHIQEKRPLTLEEIIMVMKILIYLHTHNSPYQQSVVVYIDNKTINLPFSKQLFTEIMHNNNNNE